MVYLLLTEFYHSDDLQQLDNNTTPSGASIMPLNTIQGQQGKKEGVLLLLFPVSPTVDLLR